jgi:hypothetical protein
MSKEGDVSPFPRKSHKRLKQKDFSHLFSQVPAEKDDVVYGTTGFQTVRANPSGIAGIRKEVSEHTTSVATRGSDARSQLEGKVLQSVKDITRIFL